MVSLVEQMLEAKQHVSAAKTDKDRNFYERKCEHLDKQIDGLVYELYGLTAEEIAIVEEAKGRANGRQEDSHWSPRAVRDAAAFYPAGPSSGPGSESRTDSTLA